MLFPLLKHIHCSKNLCITIYSKFISSYKLYHTNPHALEILNPIILKHRTIHSLSPPHAIPVPVYSIGSGVFLWSTHLCSLNWKIIIHLSLTETESKLNINAASIITETHEVMNLVLASSWTLGVFFIDLLHYANDDRPYLWRLHLKL